QTEVEYLPPPPTSIDVGPSTPAPAADSVYVPGCWVYRETRYFWRPGFWIAYNPNWVFVPARYIWTPAGCIFVEGHWDYILPARGLLFAPVAIERTVLVRNWSFQPRFAVPVTALVSALFVRPTRHQYYFGDYFAPGYAQHGFTPWIDYRINRGTPD